MRIEEIERELAKVRNVSANFAVNFKPNELFSRIDLATWGLLERDFILSEKEWRGIKDYLIAYFAKTRNYIRVSVTTLFKSWISIKKITVGHIVGVLSADDRS